MKKVIILVIICLLILPSISKNTTPLDKFDFSQTEKLDSIYVEYGETELCNSIKNVEHVFKNK